MGASLAVAVVFAAALSACKGDAGSDMKPRYVAIGGAESGVGKDGISADVRELIRRIASSPWELTREMVFRVDLNTLERGQIFVELGAEVRKAVHGGRRKNVKLDKLLIRYDPVYEARHVSVVPAAAGESIDGQIVYLTEVPSSAVIAALSSLP